MSKILWNRIVWIWSKLLVFSHKPTNVGSCSDYKWPKTQPFRNKSTSTKAWRLAWKVEEEEEEKWTKRLRLRGNIRSKDHLHPPPWDATTPTSSPIPVTTPTKWLPRTAQSWMGMMNGEMLFKDCSIGVHRERFTKQYPEDVIFNGGDRCRHHSWFIDDIIRSLTYKSAGVQNWATLIWANKRVER